MSQYVDGPTKTYTADATMGQYIRVKPGAAAGGIAIAGLEDRAIGVTGKAALAIGDAIPVILFSKQGTILMVANAAIARGAQVYGTANGKIDDADGGSAVIHGVALEAATAQNDVIEVLPSLQ